MQNILSKFKYKTLGVFILLIMSVQSSHALTTTASYAGTATDLLDKTTPWSAPTNATWDTTATSASINIPARTNTNRLSLTNFDLTGAWLPSNAIIGGITVNIEWNGSTNGVRDRQVYLTKDGTNIIWDNKWQNTWQNTKAIRTYGWNTDLWGTTWTVADLLSSNFWVIIEYRNRNRRVRDVFVYRTNVVIEYTINNAPTDMSLSSNTVTESMAIGTTLGVLSTTDPNTGDTHSYSLNCSTSGTDDGNFSISWTNLNTATTFNYASQSTHNICVRTTDSGWLIFDKNFTINVLDPNAPTPPLNFEIPGWYTVTEGTWNRQTAIVQEWSYALESDNGWANNSSSCFERTEITANGDTYKFWYRVSSEQDYDFLRFYDNGTEIITWSWNVAWTEYTHTPTAWTHTFRWCYTKDEIFSEGSDKAWVDNARVETPTTPGWVWWLNLWFKSNKGTSTTTDGAAMNTWNDQSWNNNNATAGTAPIFRNSAANQINYYPTIDFNGSSQFLQNLNNAADTRSYFMVIIPDNDIEWTTTGWVPFWFDCESGTLSSGTCWIPFAGLTLWAFTVAIPDEVLTHAIWSSANWRSAKTATVVYPANFPVILWVNENATGTGTDIYKEGEQINNFSVGPYQYISGADFNIWKAPDPNYPSYYDGKIAEIFNYEWRVNDTARQKIESYLAFKYGLTLNNGNTNYVASDGTTLMWSSSVAGIYNHDIFWIWYDMDQELLQPQSKSTNSDGVLRIQALGEGTNGAPNFTDISNNEFFSIAHNAGANTWQSVWAPSWYNILWRTWKTQEVGDVWTIHIDVDVENSVFNIPVPSQWTSYYLLYDSNGNNDLSDDTPLLMSDQWGNIWRYSWINMAHNRLFTIASQASSNNIPTDISLSNTSINENSGVNFNIWTLSSTDADTGDTHTYSLVSWLGDTDNQYFSISWNTLSIVHSADYEIKNSYSIRIETNDGNGWTLQKSFTITINNLGESISTSIDFESPLNSYKYQVASGNWSRTTTKPYAGNHSFESNNGWVNNTQSCFEVIHTSLSDETMSFYYDVSSEANSDYLRFYIDNTEQSSWSGTVPWAQYTSPTVPAGTHEYKWCYIKDGTWSAGTDNAFIDNIEFAAGSSDIIPPTISATSFVSGALLPGWWHTISISYSDADSWINISSDNITLQKWNGTVWGWDIASSWLILWSKVVTATGASYPMNNLEYWKYRYVFSISDNSANTASTTIDFYIDSPLLTIWTAEINIWGINANTNTFSPDINITVQTVGAPFRVLLDRNGEFWSGSQIIQSYDGSSGFGYDTTPYSWNISAIWNAQVLYSQSWSINTNGEYNIYNYTIKIGALVNDQQTAWEYEWHINFWLRLDYD